MIPTLKPYITYQRRKYKDQERRLETIFGEGDCVPVVDAKEEEPMVEEKDEGREFGQLLLKSVQELSRRIEEMGQKFTTDQRQRETPRGFHIGEGSNTSHHLQEQLTTQQVVSLTPPRSTMPTFLTTGTGTGTLQEPKLVHIGDYFVEYQTYGREFGEALTFHDFC